MTNYDKGYADGYRVGWFGHLPHWDAKERWETDYKEAFGIGWEEGKYDRRLGKSRYLIPKANICMEMAR